MRYWLLAAAVSLTAVFSLTYYCLKEPPDSLTSLTRPSTHQVIFSSSGKILNLNFHRGLNTTHNMGLHQIPQQLQKLFLLAEDKNFYNHGGVDWSARWAALYQNIKAGHIIRGASTITEQVVRIIHPRKRNLWSKYIETIEAYWLESKSSKGEILEFYLNQVPYAANRRGIAQAADFYFSRSLDTLNLHEQLALAILIRSPSRLNLHKDPRVLDKKAKTLAQLALSGNLINKSDLLELDASRLEVTKPSRQDKPAVFIDFVEAQKLDRASIHSTLDLDIQSYVENLLNERMSSLNHKNISNAAALVVNHTNGHILAYTVAGRRDPNQSGSFIDAIQTPRQPGSTLKPFLYSMALENGHSAARILHDTPLEEAVGNGIHQFNNYSRTHYGPISLRQALANSLNIPAIRMIGELGVPAFLELLRSMRITSLDRTPDFYGKGLALGNGEVSLYELTQAYTTLANKGHLRPLVYSTDIPAKPTLQVFSKETTSLIGNIMSDPVARRLEFGGSSLFEFPTQTAIKTGTSTDYRDAWTMAYNDTFLVGLWMGNLDQRPMHRVTGSMGPAIVARGIFGKLNEREDSRALYLSPLLTEKQICFKDGAITTDCEGSEQRTEWFLRGQELQRAKVQKEKKEYKLLFPTPNLIVAIDPRQPKKSQKMKFKLENLDPGAKVRWELDGVKLSSDEWLISSGAHKLRGQVFTKKQLTWESPITNFTVVE